MHACSTRTSEPAYAQQRPDHSADDFDGPPRAVHRPLFHTTGRRVVARSRRVERGRREKGSHRIGVMKRLRAACIDGSRGLEPHDDVTSHFPPGLLFFFFFFLLHFPFQCLDFCFKGESDVSMTIGYFGVISFVILRFYFSFCVFFETINVSTEGEKERTLGNFENFVLCVFDVGGIFFRFFFFSKNFEKEDRTRTLRIFSRYFGFYGFFFLRLIMLIFVLFFF